MNWGAAACIIALLSLLVTVSGFIFLSGKVVQRVDDIANDTKDHKDLLKEHGTRLGGHDAAIARLDAWNAGYESAAGAPASAARHTR